MRQFLLLLIMSVMPAALPVQLVVPSLGGGWTCSNSAAKKEGRVYQWASARVDITQQGDRIEGHYQCHYAVPAGERLNPDVEFDFSGRITSEVMRFELKSPHRGSFRVLRASAAELTVAYTVENARQMRISFGQIADNDPQILGREVK
jgi:hypothetical protein